MSNHLCEEPEKRASLEGICHNVPAAAWPKPQQHQRLGNRNAPVTAVSRPLLEVICLPVSQLRSRGLLTHHWSRSPLSRL